MPGPWSCTMTSPPRTLTSIGAPGGLYLTAFSSRFETARSSSTGSACTSGRREGGHEPDLRCACLRALDDAGDEIVELDVLDPQLALFAARELDEIRDEPRQCVQLDGRLVECVLRLVGGQATLAQEVDVRARRGQGRAQLVRRIRDEATLRADGRLERGEHRVELISETAQLVVAVDRDAFRQDCRSRRPLGGRRQPANRPQRRGGDERGEARGYGDPDASDQEDPELDAGQCLVGRGEVVRDDEAAGGTAAGHELPQVVALDRDVEIRDLAGFHGLPRLGEEECRAL